jgi:hypothetical protein
VGTMLLGAAEAGDPKPCNKAACYPRYVSPDEQEEIDDSNGCLLCGFKDVAPRIEGGEKPKTIPGEAAIEGVTEQLPKPCPAYDIAENEACTVVVLHGYNEFSWHQDYSNTRAHLLAEGYSNVYFLNFYSSEGCGANANDIDATNEGPPSMALADRHMQWFSVGYYPNGNSANSGHYEDYSSNDEDCPPSYTQHRHGIDTDLRHNAWHVAWALHNRFTAQNETINVLAYSMGGLLIRYALTHVLMEAGGQMSSHQWPSELDIRHIVTMGTPHAGTRYVGICGVVAYQAEQLCYNSATIDWMERHAQNPGFASTEWTLMGSDCDDVAPPDVTATNMDAAHKMWYQNTPGYGNYIWCPSHRSTSAPPWYFAQLDDDLDANVTYSDGGNVWFTWRDSPHAIPWAHLALTKRDW